MVRFHLIFYLLLTTHLFSEINFPETPAGRKPQNLFAAIESNDPETFIVNNFSDDFIELAFNSKLLFSPGERYEYSNVG